MNAFLQAHASSVTGMLNGFDRMRFRGTLRMIANAGGLGYVLGRLGVLLKDFKGYAQCVSERVRTASVQVALAAGRPVQYVQDPALRKEELARQICQRDGIQQGLVCVLTAVEPCWSFHVRRDRQNKKLVLVRGWRKCLHLYHYWQHPQWGMSHARLQSWFPFNLMVCLNGREWLARQMDEAGLAYVRRDNCFTHLSDLEQAQRLMDQQVKANFPSLLGALVPQVHPALAELFAAYPLEYYWSLEESEWASEVMFKQADTLGRLYPRLIRQGMEAMGSREVMRFLGKPVPPGAVEGATTPGPQSIGRRRWTVAGSGGTGGVCH